MQPSCRAKTLEYDLRGHGGWDWDETRKGSQNGFILIILSVGVWFRGLEKERGEWWCGDALRDVHWVLDQMLTSGCAAAAASLGKRARPNGSNSTASQNKRKKPNQYVHYSLVAFALLMNDLGNLDFLPHMLNVIRFSLLRFT